MEEALCRVLGYLEVLTGQDGSDPDGGDAPTALAGRLRRDIVTPSLDRGETLSNAPRRNGETFLVPQTW